MTRMIFVAFLLATGLTAPAPAQEGAGRQVASYADLDLSRSADVAKLDRRIRVAVAAACGVASDADLEGQTAERNCRAAALREAALQRSRAVGSAAARLAAVR